MYISNMYNYRLVCNICTYTHNRHILSQYFTVCVRKNTHVTLPHINGKVVSGMGASDDVDADPGAGDALLPSISDSSISFNNISNIQRYFEGRTHT